MRNKPAWCGLAISALSPILWVGPVYRLGSGLLAGLLLIATIAVGMRCLGIIIDGAAGAAAKDGRRRMRVSLIGFLLLGLAAADADACSRCGLFGNRCRYYASSTYVAPVAAVVPAQQNVYVVQNSYPAPLVGQGSSAVVSNGGYQSLTLPLFDPTAYFSQSLQLLKAANDTNALQHERTSSLVQRVAELQAPTVERLAAGQAASQVLKAAGLDPAHNASGSSSAVVISRNADGQLQVLPLESGEVQRITARLSTTTTITQAIATTAPVHGAGEPAGAMMQFCGKCHGLDVAAPKGGFYLGDDANVAKTMREKFFEITQHVANKTMPPANSPQPTDEQRAAILNEVQAVINRRKGSS